MKTNFSKKDLANMLSELMSHVQEVGAAVGNPELNYMTDEFRDKYAEFETKLEELQLELINPPAQSHQPLEK